MRFIFVIIFFARLCIASTVIQGRVTDVSNGEPLAFTNIYLAGTSLGAAANDSGYYEFTAPAGSAEIVFSRIGYEPHIKQIFIQDSLMIIDAALRISPLESEQIEITAESAAKRAERMRLFKEGFIGNSSNARLCTLVNPDVILFSETDESLQAKATDALIIRNLALGYRIHVVLDTFLLDKNTKGCFYKVYSYFQDLEAESHLTHKIWLQSRNTVFRKSAKYFFMRLLQAQKTANSLPEYEIINFAIERQKLKPMFFVKMHELRVERLYKNLPIYRLYWYENNVLRIERFKQRSYIYFLKAYLDFEENGNLIDPTQFKLNGEWANQRIADLVPYDFEVKTVSYRKRR